jgi:predicted deacylase
VSADHEAQLFLHEITAEGGMYSLMRITLGSGAPRRVLLSAGMHGDEPAGVETLCEWLETRVSVQFLQSWEITVLPCLNPWGYEHGTRENGDGRDLNREFNSPHPPQEVRFVQSVLQQRFDLSLELHADSDSTGYYLYETSQPGVEIGHRILERVQASMPINLDATIDGKSANAGVIVRPREPGNLTRWPMAWYGFAHGVPCSLTLEAGLSPLTIQIQAHLNAIEAALGLCTYARHP